VGFAEQQLGDLLLLGGFQQGIGHRRAGEGQHLGPQLGSERQCLLQLDRALPLAVDVHHQPGQLAALGEAVAVTHQGGAVLIPEADHQLAPQRQCGLARGLPLQLQIPSTWLAAVCIASSRRAVRLLREKKDCRAALA
jgi:hypothetical protein